MNNTNLKIIDLCRVARVQRSSFYYWQKHGADRIKKDEVPLDLVRKVYEKSRGKAGIRQTRMRIERKHGIKINLKKIARLKREYHLQTKIRRKRKFYVNLLKQIEHRTSGNILERDFNPSNADMVYSTDITEMRFANSKKVYLSAVKDLCTNEILAYTTSVRPGLALSVNVAQEVLNKLTQEKRSHLILHSDQGIHYTNYTYRNLLAKYSVTQSMSRRGNCLDNAPIESFFGHMKDELDLSQCKDYLSVKKKVKQYMFYYNNERPQWDLKQKTPAEYRGLIEGSPFI